MKIVIALLFATVYVHAQPGPGGGGLRVKNFYDAALQPIDLTDSTLHIESFSVCRDTVIERTSVHRNFLYDTYNRPPPHRELEREYPFSIGYAYVLKTPVSQDSISHRLLWVYERDTMMIDFFGISTDNISHHTDYMDSLVFHPGYFKWRLGRGWPKGMNRDQVTTCYNLMKNGITSHSFDTLQHHGYLEYTPDINMDWVMMKLPGYYFLRKAQLHLWDFEREKKIESLDSVWVNIQTGIRLDDDSATTEAVFLQTDYYELTEEYDNAFECLSEVLHVKRYETDWDYLENNFRQRIKMLTKSKRYHEALADYDSLINVLTYPFNDKIERERFRADYLDGCDTAIANLNQYIDSLPPISTENKNWFYTEANTAFCYFVLASAEFRCNRYDAAYEHWNRSNDLRYGITSYHNYRSNIPYLSIFIKDNPNIPELYFLRALQKQRWYFSTQKDWRDHELLICLPEEYLADYNMADSLGMRHYMIFWARASDLYERERYELALANVNLALTEDDNVSGLYELRSRINYKLYRKLRMETLTQLESESSPGSAIVRKWSHRMPYMSFSDWCKKDPDWERYLKLSKMEQEEWWSARK